VKRLSLLLDQIDGRSYKAYKELKGVYNFGICALSIDHVQGDPYAAPSRISITVPPEISTFPAHLWDGPIRKRALEDYLGRAISRTIKASVKGRRGTGKSGQVSIASGGQQVLARNAVNISSMGVEARITVALPADGRRILGKEAQEIFFNELPLVINKGLLIENLDLEKIKFHIESIEDQDFLRKRLAEESLVAFVADNSLLPRRTGIDDRPLEKDALPFKSPESLAKKMILPNRGEVRGMAIPEGVTLVVGGGFHGKSTLLHALEKGIYNHIPGDGRELVVTDPTAVKVRAEDGRSITGVDISPFIDNLPFHGDTVNFSTENASGSTSQAANIIEALQADSKLLLIDEDTSATNFMIRDERMQALIAGHREPITPFIHRVRELYEYQGVSTVIVMGGCGDYFDVSDHVIMMDTYEPLDVTEKAHRIAASVSKSLPPVKLLPIGKMKGRTLPIERLSARRGKKDVNIDSPDVETLLFGEHRIDLSAVEQLVHEDQTRTIGLLIHYYAQKYALQNIGLREGLELALKDVEENGLDVLSPWKVGNLALPRLHEVAAAINRIRVRG